MPFATNIVVPTDFSQAAELAVDAAALLGAQTGAKITLVHVHDPDALRAPASEWSPLHQKDLQEQIEETITEALGKTRRERLSRIERVEVAVLHDPGIAHAICAFAEKIGADLIVQCTHGRTGLKQLLIGSVAERVVRHASCPVLTLRSTRPD